MDIICSSCDKKKDENSFSSFNKKKSRTCDDCRKYKQDYARKNREHLLEMRRMQYHLTDDIKKKNADYMRAKRHDPKRKRQLFSNHLKRKYGIGIDDYDKMIAEQQGKCRICKVKFEQNLVSWHKPCVDHSHSSGKVRGVLCRRCNITLYYLEEYDFLNEAMRYLQVNEVKDKEPSR